MPVVKHVFLDRDGTIIRDKHYLSDPEGVELLPGAPQALAELVGGGCSLYLVSNQSGIGRGYFDAAACVLCQDRLAELLAPWGVRFVDMAFCPHAPADVPGEGCDCRKPGLGMWRQLAALHGLEPETCAMVGDKRADVGFGLNAGFAATVLVLTGHGMEHAAKLGLPPLSEGAQYLSLRGADGAHLFAQGKTDWPHAIARDLHGAATFLLSL